MTEPKKRDSLTPAAHKRDSSTPATLKRDSSTPATPKRDSSTSHFFSDSTPAGLNVPSSEGSHCVSSSPHALFSDVSFLEEFNNSLRDAIQSYRSGTQGIGPWVVAEDVSKNEYELWSMKVESKWRLSYEWTKLDTLGRILFYGDPGAVHSAACAWFSEEIFMELRTKWTDRPALRRIRNAGDLEVALENRHKTCDFSVQSIYTEYPCPPLVGEVAHLNESKKVLKEELQWWTARNCDALMAIGVKIFIAEVEDNMKYHLTYYEKWRGDATIKEVKFGPQFCKGPKDPRFIVQIPIRVLCEGDPVLPTDVSDILDESINLDLFDLQECIMAADVLERKTQKQLEKKTQKRIGQQKRKRMGST